MKKSELVKGSTEMIVLSLLSEKDCYGYELAALIEQRSRGHLAFKEGTLYPALKKMELQGWVTHYWAESPEGPNRKYYSITSAGKKMLNEQKRAWSLFKEAVERIVGEGYVEAVARLRI